MRIFFLTSLKPYQNGFRRFNFATRFTFSFKIEPRSFVKLQISIIGGLQHRTLWKQANAKNAMHSFKNPVQSRNSRYSFINVNRRRSWQLLLPRTVPANSYFGMDSPHRLGQSPRVKWANSTGHAFVKRREAFYIFPFYLYSYSCGPLHSLPYDHCVHRIDKIIKHREDHGYKAFPTSRLASNSFFLSHPSS
jgi:hypothetical protein